MDKSVQKEKRVCVITGGGSGMGLSAATFMGNKEASEGGSMLKYTAENRMGDPDELGYAIATVADERNGYLAGVDILADGGATTGKKFKKI